MRTPMIYSADEIRIWSTSAEIDGLWTTARPLSLSGISLFRRLSAAWMVFTGKADVLTWYKQ